MSIDHSAKTFSHSQIHLSLNGGRETREEMRRALVDQAREEGGYGGSVARQILIPFSGPIYLYGQLGRSIVVLILGQVDQCPLIPKRSPATRSPLWDTV